MISNAAFGVAKQLQERDSINCVVDVEFGRVARHGADVYAHGVVDVVDVDVVDALRSAWARPPVARFVSVVAVRGHANGNAKDAVNAHTTNANANAKVNDNANLNDNGNVTANSNDHVNAHANANAKSECQRQCQCPW